MSTTKTMDAKNYYGCGHTINIKDVKTQQHIRLEKHRGLWSVVDYRHSDSFPEYKDASCFFFLCEHEKMGDEAAYVIINQNYEIILEGVWNGFSDLKEYLADLDWNVAVDKFKYVSNIKLCENYWLSNGRYNDESYTVIVYNKGNTYGFYYKSGNKPSDPCFEHDYKIAMIL